jgi:hypothetical protein
MAALNVITILNFAEEGISTVLLFCIFYQPILPEMSKFIFKAELGREGERNDDRTEKQKGRETNTEERMEEDKGMKRIKETKHDLY